MDGPGPWPDAFAPLKSTAALQAAGFQAPAYDALLWTVSRKARIDARNGPRRSYRDKKKRDLYFPFSGRLHGTLKKRKTSMPIIAVCRLKSRPARSQHRRKTVRTLAAKGLDCESNNASAAGHARPTTRCRHDRLVALCIPQESHSP